MDINVIGNALGSTGYDSHTLQLSKALLKINAETSLETSLPQNWEYVVDSDVRKLVTNNYRKGWNVCIMQPPQALSVWGRACKGVIPFVVFEGDKVPKYWSSILSSGRFPLVFVPSQHVYDACINVGVRKELLRIVPHGVNEELFVPGREMDVFSSVKKKGFNFVFVGGWAKGKDDRKDLYTAVKAFCEEFKKSEDVGFLIKVNKVYNPGMSVVQELIRLGLPEDRPELFVSETDVPVSKLSGFYSCGDVFVCPSRSEGFGLTMLEAMSCGLPVITGGFGGQTDFVNEKNGWLLTPKLDVDAGKVEGLLYEGVKWASYDVKELREVMRKVFNDKKLVMKKSKEALKTAKVFSWKNSAEKVLECLKEVESYGE